MEMEGGKRETYVLGATASLRRGGGPLGANLTCKTHPVSSNSDQISIIKDLISKIQRKNKIKK